MGKTSTRRSLGTREAPTSVNIHLRDSITWTFLLLFLLPSHCFLLHSFYKEGWAQTPRYKGGGLTLAQPLWLHRSRTHRLCGIASCDFSGIKRHYRKQHINNLLWPMFPSPTSHMTNVLCPQFGAGVTWVPSSVLVSRRVCGGALPASGGLVRPSVLPWRQSPSHTEPDSTQTQLSKGDHAVTEVTSVLLTLPQSRDKCFPLFTPVNICCVVLNALVKTFTHVCCLPKSKLI